MKSSPSLQNRSPERPPGPTDDLALSHFIACAAHSVARSAQRELDLTLAGIYLGTPLPESHLVEVEKHWREARALAESAREAYARARARHAKRRATLGAPSSGPRRKAA